MTDLNGIHYGFGQDCAFCFVRCKAVRDKKVRLFSYTEQSTNWKDATRTLGKHESCEFHKIGVSALANAVEEVAKAR